MWKTVFVETDIPNPIEGGNCWTWARVRPGWYWGLCRLKLFIMIVWRVVTEQDGVVYRLDWKTAWEISALAKGLTGREKHDLENSKE